MNSKKIAMICMFAGLIVILVYAIIMKTEDFEWLESKLMGQSEWTAYSFDDTTVVKPKLSFDNGGAFSEKPTIIPNKADIETSPCSGSYKMKEFLKDGGIVSGGVTRQPTLTFSDEPDTIEWTDKYGIKHKEVWLDKEQVNEPSKTHPVFVPNFGGHNTGVFEYADNLHGITVTTFDGEVYTFYEKADGSWVRQ